MKQELNINYNNKDLLFWALFAILFLSLFSSNSTNGQGDNFDDYPTYKTFAGALTDTSNAGLVIVDKDRGKHKDIQDPKKRTSLVKPIKPINSRPLPYSQVQRSDNRSINWGVNLLDPLGIMNQWTGKGINVVVLDTGLSNHKDTEGKIKYAWDFTGNMDPNDYNGHSTWILGTIVLPRLATNVTLHAGKVFSDDGYGATEWLEKGIYWAVDHCKGDVINLSLAFDSPDPKVEEAIKYAQSKGVILVCAAGNSGNNDKDNIGWPAKYVNKYDNIIVAGSLNKQLKASYFSASGNIPGKGVFAPGEELLGPTVNNQYEIFSGTSMATPFIVSQIAMLLEMGIPKTDIVDRYRFTTIDMGEVGWDFNTHNGYTDIKGNHTPIAKEPSDTSKTDSPAVVDDSIDSDDSDNSNSWFAKNWIPLVAGVVVLALLALFVVNRKNFKSGK